MKGLLLKDLYTLRAYFKAYLLIIAVFLAASFMGGNAFFVFYPCLMCGMIPTNLIAYDERSRFTQYSESLPVSRAQSVSEKYLMGLFSQGAVLVITGIVQGIRMRVNGTFSLGEFTVMMLSLLLVSMLASAVPLPFIFKNGVEKGRLAYYVMIGIVCCAGVLFSGVFEKERTFGVPACLIFVILALLGIGVYALSWTLSIRFYRKREL